MNVYVAGRWNRRDECGVLMDTLESRGHRITHRWDKTEDPVNAPTSEREQFYSDCAVLDVEGVFHCDALVLLHDPSCRGAFVEFGIAVATRRRVVVIDGKGDVTTHAPIFYHLPEVEHVATAAEAIAALEER